MTSLLLHSAYSESLAPSGFFHCFYLNSLAAALSKRLTNPFLVASTLALHQNREMIDPDKFCSLCHATFNDPVMAQQHYVGKKHRKQETKLKLMAHYGRLADPAVTDSSGKGAQLTPELDQGLTTGTPQNTKAMLFLLSSPKAGMANTNACRSRQKIN